MQFLQGNSFLFCSTDAGRYSAVDAATVVSLESVEHMSLNTRDPCGYELHRYLWL